MIEPSTDRPGRRLAVALLLGGILLFDYVPSVGQDVVSLPDFLPDVNVSADPPDVLVEVEAGTGDPYRAGPEASDKASRLQFIETDRNCFTFSRQTAAQGQRLAEISYSYIKLGEEGGKNSYPEFIGRYGITDDFEFRFGYNFESGPASEAPESHVVNKFGVNAQQQTFYGLKYQVTEQLPGRKWVPDSSFMINGRTPIGSLEKATQVSAGYAFGWTLPNDWNLDAAIRFGTDRFETDAYQTWAPSTVIKIPLTSSKKWFTHLEYFGIFSNDLEKNFTLHFMDTGLHYFIRPSWEIGAIIGMGLNEESRGMFVSFGSGIRF